MVKVKCDKCGAINRINKNVDHYFCNQCGKKNSYEYKKEPKNYKLLFYIGIPIILIAVFLIMTIPVRQYGSKVKISDVEKYCKKSDDCYLKKAFKKHLFSIFSYKIVEDVPYKGVDKKYTIKVKQFGKTKKYTFKLVDNAGPKITAKNVTLDYKGQIDFEDKIKIKDFVEGSISLKSKKVTIHSEDVNINKEGKYEVTITAYDSKKNKTTKKIQVTVKKAVPTYINILSKDSYERNEEIVLSAEIYPETAFDKSLTWKYNDNVIESGVISFPEGGQYSICAYANAGKASSCKIFNVNKECLSRYEYYFDGGTAKNLYVGNSKDICPGTYRVTASLINDSNCAMIIFNKRGIYSQNEELMDICYNDASRQNRKLHVLNDNTYVEIRAGYTSVIFDLV